jgi:hypothetical protein
VGSTEGALGGPNKGSFDAWVIKFDGDGVVLSRQPGTSARDFAFGVATDTDGNASVVGETGGALGGPLPPPVADAWVIKFDGDGDVLWTQQAGSTGMANRDSANGVATDADGNVCVVGDTQGALGGPNKGGQDAWVIKYAR